MDIRISVREKPGYRLFSQLRKKQENISDILLEGIIPKMVLTLPGKNLSINHSWCFVMPAKIKKKNYFWLGAFLPEASTFEINSVFALYVCVSYPTLCENLRSNFHVAFWLSRLLNGTQRQEGIVSNRANLSEWIKALQRSYSPFWEKLLNEQYKFSNRSELLLSELTDNEEKINSDNGVEIMPWKGWPGCIQTDINVWLWRQSRYGRIIDSQKVSL
ncbi:hypothetical protein [Erwinia mallotivora]|uniref:T6SS protein Cts1T n=1 Tax=Erwinia mallotivora TaxID=69222 RepID=A0A014Q0J1_9GAMM|nr:hypothetical protein [Erwinia mallotivora]EXU76687.1 hypothetical protein BG55_04200 [Erwinia mallotivora]